MPRIAAAAGACLVIVLSLAWNIVRYPRVWEMVGAASHLPSPACLPSPSKPVEPTRSAAATPAATPRTIPWHATPVPLPQETLPAETESLATARRQPDELPDVADAQVDEAHLVDSDAQIAEVDAKTKPAAAAASPGRQDPQLAAGPEQSDDPSLVPLTPPASSLAAAEWPGWDPEVRRLPPVEAEVSVPVSAASAPPPDAPVPFYPGSDTSSSGWD